MTIMYDTREKPQAIRKILECFRANGVEVIRNKLYVGDYTNYDYQRVVIDRKKNLAEVANNLSNDHVRFRKELERAKGANIKMVILVEHGGAIHQLEDVQRWVNPRLKEHPLAMSGERLYRVMRTMQNRYDIEWQFCDKRCTGERIIEILSQAAFEN